MFNKNQSPSQDFNDPDKIALARLKSNQMNLTIVILGIALVAAISGSIVLAILSLQIPEVLGVLAASLSGFVGGVLTGQQANEFTAKHADVPN